MMRIVVCIFVFLSILISQNARGDDKRNCVGFRPISYPDLGALKGIGCGNSILSLAEVISKFAIQNCVPSIETRILRCSSSLHINNPREITIEGEGWKILFSDLRPGKGGLVLRNAKNVVIRNLEIDWVNEGSTGNYSTGSVVACDGRAGAALALDGNSTGLFDMGAISVWDSQTGWTWNSTWSGKQVDMYFPRATTMNFEKGKGPCLPELHFLSGERVLVRHYTYSNHAFICYECERIALEKMVVRSAPGMAFVFWGGGNGFLLRENTIAPSCSPNCLRPEPTVASDGAHFAAVGGSILIEGNDFGWQGDDSINVTGLLAAGVALDSPPAESDGWLQLDDRTKDRLWLFRAGQKILFFDMGLREHGVASVMEIDAIRKRLRLSRMPVDVREIVLTPLERIPRNVVVRNNRFHDHRARGILMAANDALIENNTIERVTMSAILIPADTDHWFEGPGANGVTIRNNRISQVNVRPYNDFYPSAISAAFQPPKDYKGPIGWPIRNVLIRDNVISNVLRNADKPVSFGVGVKND